MQAIDVIRQAQGGRAIDNLAAHFGIAPAQAEAAIAAVLPELSRHIERNTLSRGGLADIVAALGDGHHARSLDDPGALADPAMRDDGNAILGHILGTRPWPGWVFGKRSLMRRTSSGAEGAPP